MEIAREDIAVRLIEERTKQGYSQSGFARQLGISHEGLRRYEMGQREPGIGFLAKAATLGLDVQYILTGVRSANLAEVFPPRLPQLGETMKLFTKSTGIAKTTGVVKKFTDDAKATKKLLPIGSALEGIRPLKIVENNMVKLADNTISGSTVNVINTPKHVTRTVAEVKPGEEHITDEQAARLMALVKLVVEWEAKVKKKPNSYRGVWAGLNAHCRVTKYRLIALEDYDKAEKYLHQWLGRLQSMASAPVADNDTWRKRRYAYIKINTRHDESWLTTYLRKNFKAESLTDISDDELDRTYRAVASRKRKN